MIPRKAFVTDGCSGFMTFLWQVFRGKDPPWEGCCEEHDRAYWEGGPNSLRLDADIKVLQCVRANGHPHWAVIMFIAVRIGGECGLPVPTEGRENGQRRVPPRLACASHGRTFAPHTVDGRPDRHDPPGLKCISAV